MHSHPSMWLTAYCTDDFCAAAYSFRRTKQTAGNTKRLVRLWLNYIHNETNCTDITVNAWSRMSARQTAHKNGQHVNGVSRCIFQRHQLHLNASFSITMACRCRLLLHPVTSPRQYAAGRVTAASSKSQIRASAFFVRPAHFHALVSFLHQTLGSSSDR